jgi:hypothetical protein
MICQGLFHPSNYQVNNAKQFIVGMFCDNLSYARREKLGYETLARSCKKAARSYGKFIRKLRESSDPQNFISMQWDTPRVPCMLTWILSQKQALAFMCNVIISLHAIRFNVSIVGHSLCEPDFM